MSRTSEYSLRNVGCNNQPRQVHILLTVGPAPSILRLDQSRVGLGTLYAVRALVVQQVGSHGRSYTGFSLAFQFRPTKPLYEVFAWFLPSPDDPDALSLALSRVVFLELATSFPLILTFLEESSFLTCLYFGGALS